MSAQENILNTPAFPTSVTQTPASPANPMASFPMLNADGELDLSGVNMGARLQAFSDFAERNDFNLVLWATNILAQFPAGTTLLPIPIKPEKRDAWRGDDAKKMQLKPGHVEPSADFIIKVGNMLGVTLKKVYEGERVIDGKTMYSCRYNAYLMLPNGAMLEAEEEGKDQALYTNDGKMQAHIAESTRKKAKRNAIKALLGIPTSMPEEEFDRYWIVLRAIFHKGVSSETDQIIRDREAIAENSRRLLYGDSVKPTTIDVEAETGEVTVDGLKQMIQDCQSLAALEGVSQAIGKERLLPAETRELGNLYAIRKKQLEGAENSDLKV